MPNAEPDDDAIDLDEEFRCWCGEKGPYEELCDSDVFSRGCGGTGTLYCECGGDFCVCHNHGEIECPGCEDCDGDDDFNDGMDDYYDDLD